jgi:lysozyme
MVFKPVCIDLYQHDAVEDFNKVKAQGIPFLIHKASEGMTEVDKQYKARRTEWLKGDAIKVTDIDGQILLLKPRIAAYHFFDGGDPVAEANHFLNTADIQPGEDAVIDWEQVGASGHQPNAESADIFCKVLEAKLGFSVIVYSGNVAKEQLKGIDQRFRGRRLWLASYGKTFTVQQSWAQSGPWLWQDDGDKYGPGPTKIPGVNNYCDNSTISSSMTVKKLYSDWGGPAVVTTPIVLNEAKLVPDPESMIIQGLEGELNELGGWIKSRL